MSTNFFSTLETHFSMAMDGHINFPGNDSLIQEQCKALCERLNKTITSLVLSEAPTVEDKHLRNPQCSCKYKDLSVKSSTHRFECQEFNLIWACALPMIIGASMRNIQRCMCSLLDGGRPVMLDGGMPALIYSCLVRCWRAEAELCTWWWFLDG